MFAGLVSTAGAFWTSRKARYQADALRAKAEAERHQRLGALVPKPYKTASEIVELRALLEAYTSDAAIRPAWPMDPRSMWKDWLDQFTDFSRGGWGWGGQAADKTGQVSGADYPFFWDENSLGLLRSTGRLVVGTNPNAAGLLGGMRRYVFGTGSTVQVRATDPQYAGVAKQAQKYLDAFRKRNRMMFREREQFTRAARDGEGVFLLGADTGGPWVRFVWPEQIRRPADKSDDEWSFGRRCDPDDTETTLEWAVHPLDPEHETEPEYVPAQAIVYLSHNMDSGVKRGRPDFCLGVADALEAANELAGAMGKGSTLQAKIAYIRKHPNSQADAIRALPPALSTHQRVDAFGNVLDAQKFPDGTIIDTKDSDFLPSPYNAGIPAHLDVFQMLNRRAQSWWNAPEWLGTSYSQEVNFASSLTAESPLVQTTTEFGALYSDCHRDLYERVLAIGAARGELPRNVLECVEVVVTLPSPVVRDKLQEAQRGATQLANGATSPQKLCEEAGNEWDQIQKDRKAVGLGPVGAQPGPGAAGGPPQAGPAANGVPTATPAAPDDNAPFALDVAAEGEEGDGDGLLEAGFTGTIKDSLGRERHYVDGKQVASRQDVEVAGKSAGETPTAAAKTHPGEHPHIRTPEFKAWFGDWENDPANASKVVDDDGTPKETYEVKRVFHGRPSSFNVFDKEKVGANGSQAGSGFYFAEDERIAKTYAEAQKGDILEAYLSIKNPFDFDMRVSKTELARWESAAYESTGGKFNREEFQAEIAAKFKYGGADGTISGLAAWTALSNVVGMAKVNRVLVHLGHDGLTHEARDVYGTVKTDREAKGSYGRVWVAFEPTQIKSTNNKGTFDPSNPNINEADDEQEALALLEAGTFTGVSFGHYFVGGKKVEKGEYQAFVASKKAGAKGAKGHGVDLPADHTHLTIQQAAGALHGMGYGLAKPQFDVRTKTTTYELTRPDGQKYRATADEVKELVYRGAKPTGKQAEPPPLPKKATEAPAGGVDRTNPDLDAAMGEPARAAPAGEASPKRDNPGLDAAMGGTEPPALTRGYAWAAKQADQHVGKVAAHLGLKGPAARSTLNRAIRQAVEKAVASGSGSVVIMGKGGKKIRVTVRKKVAEAEGADAEFEADLSEDDGPADFVLEAEWELLAEAGFTGTDRLGRKWVDGREVKSEEKPGGADRPVNYLRPQTDEEIAAVEKKHNEQLAAVDKGMTNDYATHAMPEEKRHAIHASLRLCFTRMSVPMADRALSGLSPHVPFILYENLNRVTEKANENRVMAGREIAKPGQVVGGFYKYWVGETYGQLHIDGGYDESDDSATHIHAHELGHAVDGTSHELSGSKDWQEAFREEIDKDGDPLTKYARTNPSEGFAEYCRLLITGQIRQAKDDFPKCWAFFKARELM